MSYAPTRSEQAPKISTLSDSSTTTVLQHKQVSRGNIGRRASRTRNPKRPAPVYNDENFPIIVHCHLCWDWVWQRPQQFLSRLSQKHPILFVETVGPDPQLATVSARFHVLENFPNITVLRLQFPTWQWTNGQLVDSERRRVVRDFIQGPAVGRFEGAVQWFYDPMAITAFAGYMDEVLTVYDCMDELSKFRGAPPELLVREGELLKRADVVFTGGRRLYEAKSQYNDNCHFYGCGVDCAHFGKAREAATLVPADVANLPKPILGYFGVVDERMDYDLVARLADANPSGSVIIVGPTTKVDPSTMPQRPNLHWLGQRPYSELPAYCKAMDVCLMPFALNESTEFINPTKALEYMATGRPIVSTAVPDVVRNFGEVVRIARDPEEFVRLCAKALEQPDPQTICRGLQMAQSNSWDSIVSQLENHIKEALLKTRSSKNA